MYSDIKEWTRIRARVLKKGESIRYVAKVEAMSRNTVRKIVHFEFPRLLPGHRQYERCHPPPKTGSAMVSGPTHRTCTPGARGSAVPGPLV